MTSSSSAFGTVTFLIFKKSVWGEQSKSSQRRRTIQEYKKTTPTTMTVSKPGPSSFRFVLGPASLPPNPTWFTTTTRTMCRNFQPIGSLIWLGPASTTTRTEATTTRWTPWFAGACCRNLPSHFRQLVHPNNYNSPNALSALMLTTNSFNRRANASLNSCRAARSFLWTFNRKCMAMFARFGAILVARPITTLSYCWAMMSSSLAKIGRQRW
mmetsp:Transcript_15623/g.34142  ORF Transcript_15623/g.34142 Transcript_15623/m.34142 type:complete len:212 (-) Transcript_15623:1694-2329(-)